MGNRGWVGINQPALNGMAQTSERKTRYRGHALCCGGQQSSNQVLNQAQTLPWVWWHFFASWSGTSKDQSQLTARMQAKKSCSGIPIVYHLCQERQRCSTGKRKEQGKLVWGSTRSCGMCPSSPGVRCFGDAQRRLLEQLCLAIPWAHPQPWLTLKAAWWSSSIADVAANPKLLCWDREQ